jgi:hypothetical protein
MATLEKSRHIQSQAVFPRAKISPALVLPFFDMLHEKNLLQGLALSQICKVFASVCNSFTNL